jgi:hypothetical protein
MNMECECDHKLWDQEWKATDDAIRQLMIEQHPVLELSNSDPERERLLKPMRARAIALHYKRIDLLHFRNQRANANSNANAIKE